MLVWTELMSDVLTYIAGSQLAATQSSVTRPLSTTVKPNCEDEDVSAGLYCTQAKISCSWVNLIDIFDEAC